MNPASDADYALLNAGGKRYELIRGKLQPMPNVGGLQGNLTMELCTFVHSHVRARNLGQGFAAETGFIVEENPRTILAPDYAFILRERMPATMPTGFMPLVPDLVLETRSPGDTARAVAAKVELWLEVGAREVWELNPRRQILTVYRPDAEPLALTTNDALQSELLPGFSLALSSILS